MNYNQGYNHLGGDRGRPYGQPVNNYADRSNERLINRQDSPYGRNPGSRPQYPQERNGQMEMSSMPRGQANYDVEAQHGQPAVDPNNILNSCEEITGGISGIESLLARLNAAHMKALNDTQTSLSSPANREIDMLAEQIQTSFKSLTQRMKYIKSRREAQQERNARQVGRVDRELRRIREEYMKVDAEYRKRMRGQMERQYRIVKPDASPEEIEQACEDPNQQVFQQAMLNSNRSGQARSVLSAVQDRHAAIQKIERQMIELAQLFQDMDAMVIEQEVKVEAIDTQAEETHTNMTRGNEQLHGAVDLARSARKKKWICFGISIAIIIIIAIIVAVVVKIVLK